jgi:pyruvate-ferredoxin/flavodoxin oxidoreductase
VHFAAALPPTVRAIAVLDRTKEPGAPGDPLYLDVLTAVHEAVSAPLPEVIGGRYGLASKEFTPAMARRVFQELEARQPKRHFTIGIKDDVTGLSLDYDPDFEVLPGETFEAIFWGLGSDGTVSANKNSIKIIGEKTDLFAQGYFVYDSKKAGTLTVSHLRFGPSAVRAPYLIRRAGFIACHQFDFIDRFDLLDLAADGAVFLLNSPFGATEVWEHLPSEVQRVILKKRLSLHVIDAGRVARERGLGRRSNTIMQTCFFALSGLLPRSEAIASIKQAIVKSYGKKGDEVVQRNIEAVDMTLDYLHEVELSGRQVGSRRRPRVMSEEAPEFVQRVTRVMASGKGDLLPVSVFPTDGTWPMGTARWEKRNLAQEIPVWDAALCIQCNKCALVCPHAAIRAKVYATSELAGAPEGFRSTVWKGLELKGNQYTLQVAPEDCTGCCLCVEVCPVKDKSNPRHKAIDMQPLPPLREVERERYAFFLGLPETDRKQVNLDVKGSQLLQPLFEYSGACDGCGETPYIKLLTQLFGDRLIIANATGCSSIYGGNLPTTPYATNHDGRGPAWSNSLFEDNAEFGLGMRLALDAHAARARALLVSLSSELGDDVVGSLLEPANTEAEIEAQRERVLALRRRLTAFGADRRAHELANRADYLIKKSVWIVGGDGWAYDIGFGGLDHVLAQNHKINVLVLDTEVYSNTGGQQSKATPLGAVAKFASAGKRTPKKDLGLMAMSYRHVYVASVALGAKDAQTVRAFLEAEAHPGPSLIIAYCPCIAHGYDLRYGAEQQKLAVDCGVWPLFRYDPRRADKGEPPLKLDAGAPRAKVADYMRREARFRLTEKLGEAAAEAQKDVARRVALYHDLAEKRVPRPGD